MSSAAAVAVAAALAVAVVAVAARAAPATDALKVDAASGHFVDQYGRRRVLHGVNVVYKVPPYAPREDAFDPQASLAAVDIANLKKWGFNVVRLGVMWPGWTPAKGAADAAYAKRMVALVKKLAAAGIYTIVDMHQDLMSRKLCGEGAPDWAVAYPGGEFAAPFPLPVALPYAVNATSHYPSLEKCLSQNFAFYYVADAVQETFQQLYENYAGFADHLTAFWHNVSATFASVPGVLGYELINEPWPGNAVRHPHLLEPGKADVEHLAPLYERLHKAIRANDDAHLVFFEKALVPGQVLPSGFTAVPTGGAAYADRSVYSYHVYCAPADAEGVPRNVLLCDGEDFAEFEVDYLDARRLGTGAMMTEFGAMLNATKSIENLQYLTSLADVHFQSWTYWQFKYFGDLTTQSGAAESFYDAHGELEHNKVRALARTYAQAVAGEPLETSFVPTTATFKLSFRLDTRVALKAPTVVYYSREYYYPGGATITVTPAYTLQHRERTPGYIEFGLDKAAVNGTVVDIMITPA